MDNRKARIPYEPPKAEIICLAPQESVAASSGWQPWFGSDDAWWWTNHWGVDLQVTPSITGIFQWYDENGNLVNSELD